MKYVIATLRSSSLPLTLRKQLAELTAVPLAQRRRPRKKAPFGILVERRPKTMVETLEGRLML
jgi:hypothetical protein